MNLKLSSNEPLFTSLIREKGSGINEGKPRGTWQEKAKQNGIPLKLYRSILGESHLDMYLRVCVLFEILKKLYQDIQKMKSKDHYNLLLVTHGGFIRTIYRYIFFKNNFEMQLESAKNCHFHILEISGDFDIKILATNIQKIETNSFI